VERDNKNYLNANMAKVRTHEIDSKERYKIIGEFYETVSNLKSKKEVIDFYAGLFSPSECLMMSRRVQIAQLLLAGKSYEDIRSIVKASNQTITKTDQWLHSGDEKYDQWIKKCLNPRTKHKSEKDYYKSFIDRYPQHRFLKELFK
jgi:uncharacterized protein YerC